MKLSTCIVLGAGASFASDFNLPVMSSFFRETDLATRQDLGRLLKELFPQVEVNQYNLEEVLGFLDLSRARTSRWGIGSVKDQAHLDVLSHDILEYVRERLEIPGSGVCNRHLKLFEQHELTDSVLTLNYDLVADQALQSIDVRQTDTSRVGKATLLLGDVAFFGPTPPSLTKADTGGLYLKLHGSVNWLVCPNRECTQANYVYVSQDQSDGQRPGMPCRVCGDAITTLIVPPISSKSATYHIRLPLLWNLALQRLMSADIITIVGVSFAPSDSELRWLFRQALYVRPKTPLTVKIVNPNEEDRRRTVAVLPRFQGEVHHFASLADYIAGASPLTVEPSS